MFNLSGQEQPVDLGELYSSKNSDKSSRWTYRMAKLF
jgi:hypothetical protein